MGRMRGRLSSVVHFTDAMIPGYGLRPDHFPHAEDLPDRQQYRNDKSQKFARPWEYSHVEIRSPMTYSSITLCNRMRQGGGWTGHGHSPGGFEVIRADAVTLEQSV